MNKEQIEQAAEEYAKSKIKSFGTDGIPTGINAIKGMIVHGFKAGAEWRINSVWHDAKTTPYENSKIVLIDKYGEWYNISYSFDEYDDAFGKGWESCVRTYNIDKWAYLDDLLPTKGGENE